MKRRIDPWLLAVVAILVSIGLVMVYSASAVVAAEKTGTETYFFTRQLAAEAMGLLLCAGTAITPVQTIRRFRVVLYTASLVGLVFCFVPGIAYKANGASRWLGFGSIHLQPSEFAKLTVLLMLAHYLDRWRGRIHDYRVLLRAALIPLPAMLLIIPEPDFGTTAILGGLCAIMVFLAGIRPAHIAVLGVTGAAVGVPLMLAEQYRVQRLTSFLDPWAVEQGDGYHIIQSWVAMHSGGLWGQGLGNSMAKLHFLPEPWTDFIGAVIAEEMGLFGIFCLLCLYGVLLWRGMHIARNARDAFGTFLAATITAMIGCEAFFNLAVVMGMVPPKGLVLPFVSYGSTAMQSHLWAIGILLGISAEANPRVVPMAEGWPFRRGPLATLPGVSAGSAAK